MIYFQARTEDGQTQRYLLEEENYLVGRGDGSCADGKLTVAGDPMLSRCHFHLQRKEDSALVKRDPKARNPLFFQGVQQDEFELKSGQALMFSPLWHNAS